ncbi:hypothetical protein Aperf_G00000111282 [Anoplocephala perfoliata]
MISAKEQRYDRQLRLWGDRGQEILGKSKICLLGANAVGSELLKNLVLPGIGRFTIVDDAVVTKKDLGGNFFIPPEHIGKPRAQVVAECVSELNREVRGNFLVEKLENLIESDPNFFFDFTAIIYTGIREGPLIQLNRIVSQANIPIITCYSVGFVGFLRVSVAEHVVIESHPDSTTPDFRLDNPPQAFINLANDPENDFDSLSAIELSQVPWLIIVYKYLSVFRKKYDRFPTTYADKQEIRKYINEAADLFLEAFNSRGEVLEPSFELTNFKEASRSVNLALTETKLPEEVRLIFEDDRCHVLGNSPTPENTDSRQFPPFRKAMTQVSNPVVNPTISSFWNLAAALKLYTLNEGGGNLPLRGDLPDMTSGSKRYLKLLTVYREAAETAVEQLASRLSTAEELPIEDIRLFARNAAYLRVIRCGSLEEELKQSPAHVEDLHLIPSHEGNDAMLWYFMLRGAASFYEESGRWPGSPCAATAAAVEGGDQQFSPHIVELDMPRFRHHVNRVLTSSGVAVNRVSDDFVYEMCRFGGGEVHSIAAFMGGIAAQEVIKLITHQFVPICHPLIYNGITQQITLLEF